MSPSSSPSDPALPAQGGLFDPMLRRGEAAAAVSDQAWLRALLEVEAALTWACAEAGLVPDDAAREIAAACADPTAYDVEWLGQEATATGSVVVPLVKAIEQRAGASGSYVHLGATSQDVIDTAMMLVARRSVLALLKDLAGAAEAAWVLAATHRATAMCGRTMLQPATPTTFGLKAAEWAVALDGARARLVAVARGLPVQLGGAVGTLASYQGQGLRVQQSLARQLDLVQPLLPWHTARLPVSDLAGAAATVSGIASKIALDVVLLAQSEVAEVSEGTPGRGGSSAMPHKHNPVAAVMVRAAAARVPGLASTLYAAMAQEHERAAGSWQSEWVTVSELLAATGSAGAWLRDCLSSLQIHPDAMARNLGPVVAAAFAQSLADELAPQLGRAAARDLVAAAADKAGPDGGTLRTLVGTFPEVSSLLTGAQLDTLLAAASDVAAAAALVDRALSLRTVEEQDRT